MRIHVLQHVPFEDAGNIALWAGEKGHETQIIRLFDGDPLPDPEAVEWLVIMGGPMGVGDENQYPWLRAEKQLIRNLLPGNARMLGICLGAQLLAEAMGARVYRNINREIGWYAVEKTHEAAAHPLASVLPETWAAFHWHGDTFELPEGAVHLVKSVACPHQAFAWKNRVLALQFHLEVTEERVEDILANCAGEMSPGPWVQNDEAIRNGARQFLPEANRLMMQLLDVMASS